MVPLSQIRALTTEQTQHASNRRSEGFWNVAPASMGGGLYRIVNNTATCAPTPPANPPSTSTPPQPQPHYLPNPEPWPCRCTGPWLAIFRDAPPDLEWAPIQANLPPAPRPPHPAPALHPALPPRSPAPPMLSLSPHALPHALTHALTQAPTHAPRPRFQLHPTPDAP